MKDHQSQRIACGAKTITISDDVGAGVRCRGAAWTDHHD